MTETRIPLAGLRILDLSLLLPGPYCTQVLADLGADVVKVEPPSGDGTRHSPTGLFPIVNRNKRSVMLDLKSPQGVARCLQLASAADVFVEGFRPGVMERLGVGYDAVKQVKPDIVYCSISGYGQTGDMAQAPGHDVNYLAASGALAYSGQWQRSGPMRSGIPIADLSASMFAAVAILAALRERDSNGKGAFIDIALADCAMAFAATRGGMNQRIVDSERLHVFPTNGLFECGDGQWIALGVIEDHFWSRLADLMRIREGAVADPAFSTEAGRRSRGDELEALLVSAFRSAPASEWLSLLRAADVPITPVMDLEAAVTSAQTEHRGIVATRDGERQVMFPGLCDGRPIGRFDSRAPELGAHSSSIDWPVRAQ